MILHFPYALERDELQSLSVDEGKPSLARLVGAMNLARRGS
jgi:hypothetical protein